MNSNPATRALHPEELAILPQCRADFAPIAGLIADDAISRANDEINPFRDKKNSLTPELWLKVIEDQIEMTRTRAKVSDNPLRSIFEGIFGLAALSLLASYHLTQDIIDELSKDPKDKTPIFDPKDKTPLYIDKEKN